MLKILQWNVQYAFHARDGTPELFRIKRVRNLISRTKPDLVALTEAFYEHAGRLDYARELGFKHVLYSTSGKYGNALLSNRGLAGQEMEFGGRPALRATARTRHGDILIDLIHPSPRWSDEEKITHLKPLLESRTHPYVLLGDFNALSDDDQYDRERLIEGFKRFAREAPEAEVDRFLARKLIPYIKSQGLRDALLEDERTHTIPTDSVTSDKRSSMRIDYCFVSPEVQVIDAYIIKDHDAENGSDHRPQMTWISF